MVHVSLVVLVGLTRLLWCVCFLFSCVCCFGVGAVVPLLLGACLRAFVLCVLFGLGFVGFDWFLLGAGIGVFVCVGLCRVCFCCVGKCFDVFCVVAVWLCVAVLSGFDCCCVVFPLCVCCSFGVGGYVFFVVHVSHVVIVGVACLLWCVCFMFACVGCFGVGANGDVVIV